MKTEEGLTSKNRVKTESKKCANCGANMIFDPETQNLYCPHCGGRKDFKSEGNVKELDLASSFSVERDWSKETALVFRCDNCGAKVVLTNGETATKCPFCGTAHVEKTDELAGLKPNALIPFSFGEDKAVEYSKTWAKKKIFAPKKFKKNLTAKNISGLYAPCFTFDSFTTSIYVGRIGEEHTRTVGSGKNQRVESYIIWKNIHGTFYHNFDDLLITAGSKINQKEIDKISPYDTNQSKQYDEKFMLGFMAYHYDSEITDCWRQAKKRIDAVLRKKILNQYVYNVVDYLNVSTRHENVTYKYVMLPVYVGNFDYNKKHYNFFVNGNTGKVAGKTPVSILKIILASILGVSILAFLIFIFGSLFF